MTAQSIGIFTIEFPDPYEINYYNDQFVTLAQNVSFQYPITSNIQTLSPKSSSGRDPYGILFVPDLKSDECKSAEPDHVPANATRLANLPRDTDYALIAFAPWFSPTCIVEYFEAARSAPVKAFLVYQPGTTNALPPQMNDASWGLNDGGSWKTANDFPTYALSSSSGNIIVDQLSQYSGNVTDVPHGDELVDIFKPTDYVRLWATVNTESGNQLPSLWVFLVIVIGLLILVILSTSLGMHMVQHRRRNSLRRRIVNGEVDLEALGVKRLTVPRSFLEKQPLYTYSGAPGEDLEKTPQKPAQAYNLPSPTINAETRIRTTPLSRHPSAPTTPSSANNTTQSAFSQPTCPICLDDFEPNETQVRELPCRHIFHPDCIDTFLLSNSSLCPMCKKSVLPIGYCPEKITNIMVRRERVISRTRSRSSPNRGATTVQVVQPSPAPDSVRRPTPFGSLSNRLGGAFGGRRIFSAPERTQSRPQDIEMAGAAPPVAATDDSTTNAPVAAPAIEPVPPLAQNLANAQDCPAPPSHNRREWARQRALALLGNRNIPAEEEEREDAGPRWRRGLRKMFPGFR